MNSKKKIREFELLEKSTPRKNLQWNTPIILLHNWQFTVYTQYFGTKKPLDGLAHFINIGAQMREWFWLKRHMADILLKCLSSAEDKRKWHRSNVCSVYEDG